jgi:hypothetical protein
MSFTKPDSADYTDMDNQVANRTVATVTPTNIAYPEWMSPNYTKWLGYYTKVPDLKSAIDAKATWTVGKGYKAKPEAEAILDKIKGFGKESFNSILANMSRTYTMNGDAFAHIVTKEHSEEILNLKPLDPNTIKIMGNSRSVIARYEQWANGKIINKFRPEEIFHLCWGRTGGSIHGTSTVESIEDTILAMNEAYGDMRVVFHRYVKPLIVSIVDTDDTSEIAAYKQKLDKAVDLGENMVVPKGTLDSMERMAIPANATLDPIPWIQQLQRRFIIANGIPEIVLGHGSSTTEATSKILYLAFQQMVEGHQTFIEEQVKAQLGLDIELEFPASIEPAVTETSTSEDYKKERSINNMEVPPDGRR